jgi:hypothetical protein
VVEAKLGTAAKVHTGLKLDKDFTAFGKLRERILTELFLNSIFPATFG